MKTLIIYQSRYGSTRQYAKWINETVESDITDISGAEQFDFTKYDIIVLGTYFHASHIKTRKYIIDNWDKLSSKKVILFSASGSPAEYALEAVRTDLPRPILGSMTYYPLGGRFQYRKLTKGDKIIMHLGRAFAYLANKKEMARHMLKDYDYVSKDNIKVITDKIEELINN